MVAGNAQRLSKLARELNVGISTIVEFLHKKGFDIRFKPQYQSSRGGVSSA
jgi:translation initiation factor IF-2